MVSRVEFSKCQDMKSPSRSQAAAVQKVLKAAKLGGGGKFQPMPVADFISKARLGFIWGDIGGGCVTICVFGDYCYTCCLLDRTLICGPPIVVKG